MKDLQEEFNYQKKELLEQLESLESAVISAKKSLAASKFHRLNDLNVLGRAVRITRLSETLIILNRLLDKDQ